MKKDIANVTKRIIKKKVGIVNLVFVKNIEVIY